MKPGVGTIVLVTALLIVFGIELATHTVGNETLLLKLGALPDNAELHGEYWRLGIYSFLRSLMRCTSEVMMRLAM